jgi:hypothetical protein
MAIKSAASAHQFLFFLQSAIANLVAFNGLRIQSRRTIGPQCPFQVIHLKNAELKLCLKGATSTGERFAAISNCPGREH